VSTGISKPAQLWAPRAWVQGAWAESVLLEWDARGCWSRVQPGVEPPPGAERLPGAVLPGLVNAHSHAFQRAFAGLAERRDGAHDDFWSWRERMYAVALRITPEQLHAVARHLYSELLAGGYTQVCEFHYLHHQPDGTPYTDEAALAMALVQAAHDAGIGLTLLPVLYQRAGFDQPALRAEQRRFAAGVERVLQLRQRVQRQAGGTLNAGVAIHSLRAAEAAALRDLAAQLQGDSSPIHVHVAEQTAEVDDCLAATGLRPIQWLLREMPLDHRWQLVHATHALPDEVSGIGSSGAGVVLCPGTEANLGDGVPDLPSWLASRTPLSIGSDSHVTRSWPEELRWLEYTQRLLRRQRNVAAAPPEQPATAARLFERMLAGGAAAAGLHRGGLQAGARADLVLIAPNHPALIGVPPSHQLDALVFAAPERPFVRTMVAGRWCAGPEDTRRFEQAMQQLWGAGAG
jgi:formimidoylglutamate deiminase